MSEQTHVQADETPHEPPHDDAPRITEAPVSLLLEAVLQAVIAETAAQTTAALLQELPALLEMLLDALLDARLDAQSAGIVRALRGDPRASWRDAGPAPR